MSVILKINGWNDCYYFMDTLERFLQDNWQFIVSLKRKLTLTCKYLFKLINSTFLF